MNVKSIVAIVVAALFILILPFNIFSIDSGERAVVRTFGSVSGVWDDGLHFKVPFTQSVTVVDVRTRKAV